PRRTEARGHRQHSATALAEAEPVHGSGGEMHERARRGRHRFGADTEIDLTPGDEKGLVPGMAVGRRAAALRPLLGENFIAPRRLAGGEHGDVLADDAERRGVVLWCDHERPSGHMLLLLPGTPPVYRESTHWATRRHRFLRRNRFVAQDRQIDRPRPEHAGSGPCGTSALAPVEAPAAVGQAHAS